MILTQVKRERLAVAVVKTMADWGISAEKQLYLLNLDKSPREIAKLKNGKALPDERKVLDRARQILGIGEALRGYFPLNHKGAAIWLRNKNKYFPKRSPIEVMLEDGSPGLQKVWTNLDCTQGWD